MKTDEDLKAMRQYLSAEVRADALEVEVRESREREQQLLNLTRVWEQRVVCPQCGMRYQEVACGPSHASVWALLAEALHEAGFEKVTE